MKYKYLAILVTGIFVASFEARAETLGRHGILIDDQGSIFSMSQSDAMKGCTNQGMHLATIRELLGNIPGIVIKEPNEVTEDETGIDGTMKPIAAVNPDGKTDKFYYGPDGSYTNPAGDLGLYWFWSSSVDADDTSLGYSLDGGDGLVGTMDREDDSFSVARCFAN